MRFPAEPRTAQLGQGGFVLPAVIVTLVILAVVSITALNIGTEERNAAQATRQGARAFYAAEAGLHDVWASWDDYSETVDTLAPGDSLVIDWQTLASGDRYRAVIQRIDNGGQAMYALRAEGRAAGGPKGGRRVLSLSFTPGPPSSVVIGRCCSAALTIRGAVELKGGATIDGNDAVPPNWDESCPDAGDPKPGIIMEDTTQVAISSGTIDGNPPLVQDTTISDFAFDQYGDLTWEELKQQADHVIDADPEIRAGNAGYPEIRPSYVTDPVTDEVLCNTNDPFNWGSDVPGDPCFDYFPIILVQGELEIHNGYGQGVVIIDWDDSKPAGQKGGEFELETNTRFNGVILGKGCVEIQKGALMHGSVYVDANYRNEDLCDSDQDYDMNDSNPQVHWSQCAVNRALATGGLKEEVEHIPGDPEPIGSRAFVESTG